MKGKEIRRFANFLLAIIAIICLSLAFIEGNPFIHSNSNSTDSTEAKETIKLKPSTNTKAGKAGKASLANPSKPSKSKPESPASQGLSAASADMRRVEADVKKAEADIKKAEADVKRAEAEAKRVELEGIKAEAERRQFYFDYAYRILLLAVAIGVLIWLIPQIQEISLPWGSGTFTARRAPKETIAAIAAIAAGVGSDKPPAPQPTAAQVAQAAKALKETLISMEPGPATSRIVDKLEETEAYQAAGVSKDSIYVCHRARRIPRSEYHRVYIYLDADEPSILDKVDRVTYRFHPTFTQSEIAQTDRKKQFRLEITAWGEFMLYALVYFKGVDKAIQLKRYLNL